MSQKTNPDPGFQNDEERWFYERSQERKRPSRSSPTTPPPPIGDDMADRWFR